jgi:hypothetical protein
MIAAAFCLKIPSELGFDQVFWFSNNFLKMGADDSIYGSYWNIIFDAWVEASIWCVIVADHYKGLNIVYNVAAVIEQWGKFMSSALIIWMNNDLHR